MRTYPTRRTRTLGGISLKHIDPGGALLYLRVKIMVAFGRTEAANNDNRRREWMLQFSRLHHCMQYAAGIPGQSMSLTSKTYARFGQPKRIETCGHNRRFLGRGAICMSVGSLHDETARTQWTFFALNITDILAVGGFHCSWVFDGRFGMVTSPIAFGTRAATNLLLVARHSSFRVPLHKTSCETKCTRWPMPGIPTRRRLLFSDEINCTRWPMQA